MTLPEQDEISRRLSNPLRRVDETVTESSSEQIPDETFFLTFPGGIEIRGETFPDGTAILTFPDGGELKLTISPDDGRGILYLQSGRFDLQSGRYEVHYEIHREIESITLGRLQDGRSMQIILMNGRIIDYSCYDGFGFDIPFFPFSKDDRFVRPIKRKINKSRKEMDFLTAPNGIGIKGKIFPPDRTIVLTFPDGGELKIIISPDGMGILDLQLGRYDLQSGRYEVHRDVESISFSYETITKLKNGIEIETLHADGTRVITYQDGKKIKIKREILPKLR